MYIFRTIIEPTAFVRKLYKYQDNQIEI